MSRIRGPYVRFCERDEAVMPHPTRFCLPYLLSSGLKPMAIWEPSQYGFICDAPQRHIAAPELTQTAFPAASSNVNGPFIFSGPLGTASMANALLPSASVGNGIITLPSSLKLISRWLLSQYGISRDAPQRQNAARWPGSGLPFTRMHACTYNGPSAMTCTV